jgi:hypothetical protein
MCLLAAALSFVGAAAADDRGLRLRWVRGPGAEHCVHGDVLEDELRATLGSSGERAPRMTVEGLIKRDAQRGGFRAFFHVLDAAGRTLGTRELHSAERDCARATPSLLLVLSVLAELAVRDVERLVPVLAQAGDAELPKAVRDVAPERPWQLQPMAATGVALGMSPEVSLGLTVGAELHTPWAVSAVLRGTYWPAGQSDFQRANGRLGAIDFHMYQAELAGCLPLLAPRALRLDMCWGATLLARHVRLFGLPSQQPSLRATLGLSASLSLAYAVSARWSILLTSSVIGLSRRDRYAYADAVGDTHSLYRASPVAAALSVGIGATL